MRDQIFAPFFTTKEVGRGTGQGLSIAHDVVVNKHGGSIDIDSIEHAGTTFIIKLPLDSELGSPLLEQDEDVHGDEVHS